MWWCRVALILTLAGCGFAPVYGPDAMGRTSITTPETLLGYELLDRLQITLGTPVEPTRHLTVTVAVSETTSVITESRETQRYSLVATATWTLTGAVEDTGTVRHFTSYSASDTPVATEAARADAERRLALGLAERITAAVK